MNIANITDTKIKRRPLICGFLKVKDELVRGNLRRCLTNMLTFCDTIIACDDASTDGTDLVLRDFFVTHGISLDQILTVPREDHDFRQELAWKQKMMELVHPLQPKWIWWQDADEILPEPHNFRLRQWLEADAGVDGAHTDVGWFPGGNGYRFPYTQLWRSGSWARVDDGFDDGVFVKLWRWRDDLEFDHTVERTHHIQFPKNLGAQEDAPTGMYVLHYGNFGKCLTWKCIQYANGLGGVERHLDFDDLAIYRKLEDDFSGYPILVAPSPSEYDYPIPFSPVERQWIRAMGNLKKLEGWFTVVIPTYNRGQYLEATLASLRKQIYQKWVALVLDDGSTDNTPALMQRLQESDPRIFYVRHAKRGAVAMNEIGMACAVEWTQYWTRLGSDDYFEPRKLLNDAIALKYHQWVYGPYKVLRKKPPEGYEDPIWQLAEMCGLPEAPEDLSAALREGNFRVSWANCAARTSILDAVRKRYGNFVDPSLHNMEDFLLNARLARFAEPVWRGRLGDKLIIAGARSKVAELAGVAFDHDAVWRVNPVGASADTVQSGSEDALTRELILKEGARQLINEEGHR